MLRPSHAQEAGRGHVPAQPARFLPAPPARLLLENSPWTSIRLTKAREATQTSAPQIPKSRCGPGHGAHRPDPLPNRTQPPGLRGRGLRPLSRSPPHPPPWPQALRRRGGPGPTLVLGLVVVAGLIRDAVPVGVGPHGQVVAPLAGAGVAAVDDMLHRQQRGGPGPLPLDVDSVCKGSTQACWHCPPSHPRCHASPGGSALQRGLLGLPSTDARVTCSKCPPGRARWVLCPLWWSQDTGTADHRPGPDASHSHSPGAWATAPAGRPGAPSLSPCHARESYRPSAPPPRAAHLTFQSPRATKAISQPRCSHLQVGTHWIFP